MFDPSLLWIWELLSSFQYFLKLKWGDRLRSPSRAADEEMRHRCPVESQTAAIVLIYRLPARLNVPTLSPRLSSIP
jgi:hypothetical protein